MTQEGKQVIQQRPLGIHEGMARCLSQMCTYPFETGKTQMQVLGISKGPLCFRGILQSSISSGIVFGGYFSIYNSLEGNPLASSIASFLTSFIKIPIGNCMRIMQLNNKNTNIIKCGKRIMQKKGIYGLYSGYSVSILEDVIETNIRNNVYETLKKSFIPVAVGTEVNIYMLIGAFAGSLAAGLTTPFDTIRANMASTAVTMQSSTNMLQTTQMICKRKNGLFELYNGVKVRSLTNATRYALFYFILELLDKRFS